MLLAPGMVSTPPEYVAPDTGVSVPLLKTWTLTGLKKLSELIVTRAGPPNPV